MAWLRLSLLSSSLPWLYIFSAHVESTFKSSSDMAPFTAVAGTGGPHPNTTKDFLTFGPLIHTTITSQADVSTVELAPLIHMTITSQADVSTVELGTTSKSRTTLPTPELEHITPGADNCVSTLATPNIINHTTVDDNFDGHTSAAGNVLIPPSPPLASTAIIDQDSKTSFVNPTHTFLPQIITIRDLPHPVKCNSESQYLVEDKTLAPSLQAITISGTPISLFPYPASQIIIGSTTISRWMPLTPLHSYLTPLANAVANGYPLPDVPAASATLGHLPNLSRPAFTPNPAGYTGTRRSNTETDVPGVAVLPTRHALPSSKGSTPLPLLADATAMMESGARGLLAAAFGLGVCLWWV